MESQCPVCSYSFESESDSRRDHTLSVATDAVEETILTCPGCGTHLSQGDEDVFSYHVETELSEPRRFGRFELQRILGRGGFGTVWLATDTQLDREVAVKLPVKRRSNASSLVREAKTAAQLRHPNIVTVHEVGEFEGQVFIVCEYVSGMDLRSLLIKGLPSQDRVVELLQGIAAGLQNAHEHQIVHRDMKPANVLVEDSGTPLVADFGLAKVISVEESISSRGKIVGTILYMAPEQASNDLNTVDHRADIYALGVMMYEMLTGERPFRGNIQAVLSQKANDNPTPLRQLRPSIPLDLETICLKCLQRAPGRRYQSAAEFSEELDRFCAGVPILARPVSQVEMAWRWCQRNRMVAALSSLFILSLLVGLIGTTTFWLEARRQTQQANRSLYASQMILAADQLFSGDFEATGQTLDRYLSSDLTHLRGFEWHFLQSKLKRLVATNRHGHRIEGLAISRDGDWIATIADDRFLRISDFKTAQPIREIPFQVGRWQAIDICDADNQLAAGAKDGSVYVWDSISEKTKLPKIFKHGVGVRFVKFSGDGKRLFSSGDLGAVRVWEVGSWDLISEIPTGREGLLALDVSHDGKLVVTIGNEGVIRSWDVDDRKMNFTIRDGRPIKAVAISPDEKYFVAGTRTSHLLVHDIHDGSSRLDLNTRFNWISSIRFLANSSLFAICSSEGSVAVFDAETNREVASEMMHQGADTLMDVSKNGTCLVIGSRKGIIRTIDYSDFRKISVIANDQPLFGVQFLAPRTAVATYRDGSIRKLDFETGSSDDLFKTVDRNPIVQVSDQNALIAIACEDSAVQLIDASGDNIASVGPSSRTTTAMALSRSGKLLVLAQPDSPLVVYSIDRKRKEIVQTLFSMKLKRLTHDDGSSDRDFDSLFLSDDEELLAVTLQDHRIRFVDLQNQRWRSKTLSFDVQPNRMIMTGDRIVVGDRAGFLHCYDQLSLRPLWQVKAHASYVNDLTYIPGGDAVASVGDGGEIQIWDLQNGDQRIRLYRDIHQIFSVDASSDGKSLISGGIEGNARIWTTEQ